MVYELDSSLKAVKRYYLASDEEVKAAIGKVEAQGKALPNTANNSTSQTKTDTKQPSSPKPSEKAVTVKSTAPPAKSADKPQKK